jgi:hypothetical protein
MQHRKKNKYTRGNSGYEIVKQIFSHTMRGCLTVQYIQLIRLILLHYKRSAQQTCIYVIKIGSKILSHFSLLQSLYRSVTKLHLPNTKWIHNFLLQLQT